MSDDLKDVSAEPVPHVISPGAPGAPGDMSQEDLMRLLRASGMPGPEGPPGKNSLRRKLIIAVVIAAVGLGASIMSCVGQSFSYRQARAMEGIEQELKGIRASCTAGAPVQPTREEAR